MVEEKNTTEKVFYEDEDQVKVTSARFIVVQETYPISSISSVKNEFSPSKRFGAICWASIGFIWSCSLISAIDTQGPDFSPGFGMIISATLFYMAWYFYENGKEKYIVTLRTSGSEHKALESKNKEKIDHVVKALNDAIVFRG